MAKRVFSIICRSVAAGSSKQVGSSPSAITGKSSRGSVDRLKRERPATICIFPSAAVISTWLPSGSLRTISKRVCAETVVAPGCDTAAGTLSSTCRSRSVAISRMAPSSRASINTLERIGIVLRRSTTDWTWPRLFRRTARSIVAFIARKPHHPHALRITIASRTARGSGQIERRLSAGLLPDRRPGRGLLARQQDRVDMMDNAVGILLVTLGDRRLVALGIGDHGIAALLGRGEGAAAHCRQYGLALAHADRLVDVGDQHSAGQDEIGQGACQLRAILGIGVEGPRRRLVKRGIVRNEDGVGPWPGERLIEAGRLRRGKEPAGGRQPGGNRLGSGGLLSLGSLGALGFVPGTAALTAAGSREQRRGREAQCERMAFHAFLSCRFPCEMAGQRMPGHPRSIPSEFKIGRAHV